MDVKKIPQFEIHRSFDFINVCTYYIVLSVRLSTYLH